MIVGPLARYRRRKVALLEPGWRTLRVRAEWTDRTYTGRRAIEAVLRKLSTEQAVCYVSLGLSEMRRTTSATDWRLSLWRGRAVSITYLPTGLNVRSLRGTLGASEDPYRDLMVALAWIGDRGVEAKSLPAMAWDLWRSTLSEPVRLGADPQLGHAALFGGRQAAEPGAYWHSALWDIRSAYPTAMASRPVATSLREVSPATRLDFDTPGLITGTVFVPPDLPYAPLPVREGQRIVSYPVGPVSGTWTWREAKAATMLGCELSVDTCYAPRREVDLFGPWWETMQAGRAIPGPAGSMMKAISNSLWGQFALRGEGGVHVYWSDDAGESPIDEPRPDRNLPHHYTAHIAAEISSRVRVQTLLEGMYESEAVQHVDTDGIIASRLSDGPVNQGDAPGQWRIKEEVHELEVLAPQLYRYTRDTQPGVWHYVAAGMSEQGAWEAFRERQGHRSAVTVLSIDDVTIPTYVATDREARWRLIHEAALEGLT